MDFKKTPNLRAVGADDTPEDSRKPQEGNGRRSGRFILAAFLALTIIAGAGILRLNHTFKQAVKTASYKNTVSGFSNYARFKDGIVRYSRDGVAFLNRRNEEQWIYPCQMGRPSVDINMGTFAVADLGGNSILVFTRDGIKGEMRTALPIDKFSVSAQGVVSAVLKNGESCMIVLYDAAGNILVEQQIRAGSYMFPTALAISKDGATLGVCYLNLADFMLKGKIVFYNYGKPGSGKIDNVVSEDAYDDEIFSEIHFLGEDTAAAVGDRSFILYRLGEIPEKKKEVLLDKEIKSVFYTDKYIGFILLNADRPGYEARLYDKNGGKAMSYEFTGEYTDIKMADGQIIMTAGSKCIIITKRGTLKFKGEMPAQIQEIIPLHKFSGYLVMSGNELNVVYLTK